MSEPKIEALKNLNNLTVTVDEGESCNVTYNFTDMLGAAIAKASILTLTATLFDEASEDLINSRNAQTVLDANGGVVATDGTLVLRLQPADNVIVSTTLEAEKTERHILKVEWTWNDGVLVRTGKALRAIIVQNGASPT